jgi:hypothetical protein
MSQNPCLEQLEATKTHDISQDEHAQYLKKRNEYLSLLSLPFTDPHDHLQLYHECIFFIISTSPSFPLVLLSQADLRQLEWSAAYAGQALHRFAPRSYKLTWRDLVPPSGPIIPFEEHTLLLELLEDATSGFGDDERVWGDERYCELWEIYVEILGIPVHEPNVAETTTGDKRDSGNATAKQRKSKSQPTMLEIYDTMYSMGVGKKSNSIQKKYVSLLEEARR